MSRSSLLSRVKQISAARRVEDMRNQLQELVYSTRYAQEQAIAILEEICAGRRGMGGVLDVEVTTPQSRDDVLRLLRRDLATLKDTLQRNVRDVETLRRLRGTWNGAANDAGLAVELRLRRRIRQSVAMLRSSGITLDLLVSWKDALLEAARNLRRIDSGACSAALPTGQHLLNRIDDMLFEDHEAFLARAEQIEQQFAFYVSARDAGF